MIYDLRTVIYEVFFRTLRKTLRPLRETYRTMKSSAIVLFILILLLSLPSCSLDAQDGTIVDRRVVDLKALPELQSRLYDTVAGRRVLKTKYR